MVGEGAQSLTWKHRVCRSAPRDACSVHRAQSLPGWAAEGRGRGSLLCTGKGFASGPWTAAAANLRAGGPAESAAGAGAARRCRARGSRSARGGARHSERRTATTRARSNRRGARATLGGRGPAPPAGAFVPLTGPLLHAGRRNSPHPAPASSQVRSHDQVSVPREVGSALGGRGHSRRPLRPRRPGHPARPPNSPARTAPRALGHVPSPGTTQGAFGACRALWPVSELVRRKAGRKEESDLKSHSSSRSPSQNVAGSAAGRDARRRTQRSAERAARLVPRPQDPNAQSPNWRTQ